jgi:thiamine kinase
MTPEKIAASFFNVDASTVHATRIKHGLTNESYRVVGCGQPVVVRISNANSKALQINRESEAVVLRLVEQANIGAPVLYYQPETQILITRELPGRNPDRNAVATDRSIERLSQLFATLHSLNPDERVQSLSLVQSLEHYWRLQGSEFNKDMALSIAQESDDQKARCLCHNDVHHLNLIDNGERLWLLDWEYAAIGDPLFDLASVCCYHEFNLDQRHSLLRQYSPSANDELHTRLGRMCWLFNYIKTLWFEVRARV